MIGSEEAKAPDPEYVAARRVLLDALEVTGETTGGAGEKGSRSLATRARCAWELVAGRAEGAKRGLRGDRDRDAG